MAVPENKDLLLADERLALQEMLQHNTLMSALRKVFAYDERVHAEAMENAALADQVSTNAIIREASAKRAARGFEETIRRRMEALTVAQR